MKKNIQSNKINSIIRGCGAYLPKKIITNDDLSKMIDTSDDWISSRTGIKQRHVVEGEESTSFLAIKAAKNALEQAGMSASEIDLIIVGTTTPDKTFPATAVMVQSALGINHGAAFDVQAVCAGFVYALSVADSMIKCGNAQNVLVIGADSMSKIVDWSDRGTCILFGDGAGALILSASKVEGEKGIISSRIYSDGGFESILYTDGGVSTTQNSGVVRMQGKEVFKHAVDKMSLAMTAVLEDSGVNIEEVDHVVPHQANARILEAVAKKMNIPREKVVMTVDMHANTSAASIPLALNHLLVEGKLIPGDLVLLSGIGGGLSWGSALLRW